MGYPPPPPPPGAPGNVPPQGPAGYGAPPPGYAPPPPPGGGFPAGPPTGAPPPGGPPPGYAPGAPPPSGGGKGGNTPLILLMAALVVVVLMVVVGALVLVLRGDGDSDVELTRSQREDALLTEGDVGHGFSVSGSGDDSDDDERPTGSAECEALLDELDEVGQNPFSDADDSDDEATIDFTDEDGATIQHSVGPDEDTVATYRDVVAECDELTFADDTGDATIRFIEADPLDDVDGSLVADIEFSFAPADGSGEVTYGGRLAVWSYRGNASFLVVSDGLDFDGENVSAVPFDDALFEDLARTADEKLREVVDEA